MTTSLRFTLQLIEALPDIRLTADLSHYVVGEEFDVWPVSAEDHSLIHRIIERADSFQGRVATREQVQITAGWASHQPWLELFSGWWEEGFRLWRERSDPDDNLVFVTELGPPSYAITGEDGAELSDRWTTHCSFKESLAAFGGAWTRRRRRREQAGKPNRPDHTLRERRKSPPPEPPVTRCMMEAVFLQGLTSGQRRTNARPGFGRVQG